MENTNYVREPFFVLGQNEKINPYALSALQEELNQQEISCAEVERLCYLIVSNLCDDRPLFELQDNTKKILWYDYVRIQIFLFIKGHGEYSNDSTLLTAAGSIVVSDITDSVMLLFGVEQKLVSLIVSFLICVIAKISVNAWCDYFYNNTIKDNEELVEKIKKLEKNK